MELIFLALAIYGALHAAKNGVKVARASAALSRTNAQGRLPKNSPKSIMKDTRRRATTAWWLREIGNGFPATLGGMKQGWHAHQTAAAKQQADATASRARMLTAVAKHRARTAAEQAKIDAAKPPAPPVQAPPAGQPGRPVMAPPPSGQPARPVRAVPPISQTAGTQTASTQAAGGNGQPMTTQPINPADWKNSPSATCTDPSCPYCHAPSGSNGTSGQPSGQPSASPNGGTMSDLTYDGIMNSCAAIEQHIEQAVNTPHLTDAEAMADQIGPALPDDAESLGAAGDLVSALQAVKAAQDRAAEAARHLKDTVEKNHGAANEAAKATGHMAEREVHTNA